MNKKLAITAISLVAIAMGMSAFAPAMAVPSTNSSADVRICHQDAESGLYEPISVNDKGAQKHYEHHINDFGPINSDGTEDEDCLGINM